MNTIDAVMSNLVIIFNDKKEAQYELVVDDLSTKQVFCRWSDTRSV